MKNLYRLNITEGTYDAVAWVVSDSIDNAVEAAPSGWTVKSVDIIAKYWNPEEDLDCNKIGKLTIL